MKLYIDTSSSEEIIIELNNERFTAKAKQEKSQRLLPFIEEVIKSRGITMQDITEIEVHIGPGSFTGLRVGVSVAQALGWVLDIPVNGKKVGTEEIEIQYE